MVVGNKFPEKIILVKRMFYYIRIYKTLVFEISMVYDKIISHYHIPCKPYSLTLALGSIKNQFIQTYH